MGIEFVPAICPKCGGELRVPASINKVKCMYCGVDILISNKESNKTDVGTLITLANISFNGKNFIEAYRYFARALEFDKNNLIAWLGKGKSAAWLSTLDEPRFVEAITCYQHANSTGQENPKLMEVTQLEIIRSFNNYMKKSYENLVFELKKYKGMGEKVRPICENICQNWINKIATPINSFPIQLKQMGRIYDSPEILAELKGMTELVQKMNTIDVDLS